MLNLLSTALRAGDVAVIPALPEVDTVKVVDTEGYVVSTPERSTLRKVQTPQGFSYAVLKAAHATPQDATDDAVLVADAGHRVRIIAGEESALKITTPSDLATAMTFIGKAETFRTGVGVDAHAFGEGRELWLAGLCNGLVKSALMATLMAMLQHMQSVMRSLLQPARVISVQTLEHQGPEYAGASGSTLLRETLNIVTAAGYSISNVTVQIIGNRPRIGARRAEAITAISTALGGVPVSILATTTDGMGLTGEGKGIAAIATALVTK